MSDPLQDRILEHLKSQGYRPLKPRRLAHELEVEESQYHAFRDALKDLMHEGRVVLGSRGAVVLPTQKPRGDEFEGTYRHNKRGFGFVVPTDPTSHEDLFIPPGENGGAITGDVVRAKITSRGQRDGKAIYTGRITEVVKRTNKRFVGSLIKSGGQWMVLPDGNTLTEAILTPDAASRHIKPGTKVVVELTSYPEQGQRAQGVITEVLGAAGEKDVDLKSIIVQYNLPGDFPDAVKDQARAAVDTFDARKEANWRLDLSDEVICTIDPDDAKDYDDAISLKQVEQGYWELGVHIADVSYFVKEQTPLDLEAVDRGNSTYFPGYVIPMLPEVLSNGVCSLQEGVPRLCKSAFITYDDDAQPIRARFANTIIQSDKRLRYREAQAIIDGALEIPHPDGPKRIGDYPPHVVELLKQMNTLAKRLQKRRRQQGQLVLNLPSIELGLDEEGRVVEAIEEDQSFTHTLIEMFMVEANEAVARLFDSLNVPFIRRVHPGPDVEDADRLRQFVHVAGYKLPKEMDRKALQALLEQVKDKPEGFAINLAILKSLSRAEYSPERIGHYALASENYCHFTSPIRRYADLTVHRLLDAYFAATGSPTGESRTRKGKKKITLDDIPTEEDLFEIGRHISFTERRSQDAERELRQVKVLTLLQDHVGEEFTGVVTGITNFGIFVQIQKYLIDGLIRYENLLDDWWDVDERSGSVRGQRTGTRIGIGDVTTVRIGRVDLARRELDLVVIELRGRSMQERQQDQGSEGRPPHKPKKDGKPKHKQGRPQRPGFRDAPKFKNRGPRRGSRRR